MSKTDVTLTEEDAKRLWDGYVRTHGLPPGVPVNPDRAYVNEGWTGWRDWIGAHVKVDEVAESDHDPALEGLVESSMDDDDGDEQGRNWTEIGRELERRIAELNEGATKECYWSWHEYGCLNRLSTDGILTEFEDDVRWLAREVMADFPQARNLRWYHLISQAYDDHTLTVAVTFDAWAATDRQVAPHGRPRRPKRVRCMRTIAEMDSGRVVNRRELTGASRKRP